MEKLAHNLFYQFYLASYLLHLESFLFTVQKQKEMKSASIFGNGSNLGRKRSVLKLKKLIRLIIEAEGDF